MTSSVTSRLRAATCAFTLGVVTAFVGAAACGENLGPPAYDSDASASFDGSTTDEAAVVDAPIDAGACPVFRDDFNRTDLAVGWTTTVVNDGNIVGDGMTFRAQTAGGQADVPRDALLVKNLDVTPKSLTCTFKLRLDTMPNVGLVDAFSVALIAPDGKVSRVRLTVQHAGISLREDVYANEDGGCVSCPKATPISLTAPIPGGELMTISFFTDFVNEVTVKRNGVTAVGGAFGGFVPAKVNIVLGIVNFDTEAATHTYEDLVCELGCQ